MRFIGPALSGAREALGLDGAGSQVTEFPDGIAEQVVDMSRLIRRGVTYAGSEGLFSANMGNVHAGVGTINLDVDPYAPVGVTLGAGWPAVIPPGMDVWVLSAAMIMTAAVSTTSGVLTINYPVTKLGFATLSSVMGQQVYTSIQAVSGEVTIGTQVSARDIQGAYCKFIGVRVPRGTTLRFSSVATGAVTHYMILHLGLFAAGLGQDGLGAG
jgi:hypothetical protein